MAIKICRAETPMGFADVMFSELQYKYSGKQYEAQSSQIISLFFTPKEIEVVFNRKTHRTIQWT